MLWPPRRPVDDSSRNDDWQRVDVEWVGATNNTPIADWFHVRGGDALLIWVITAPVRREFNDDEALFNANGRLLRGLLRVARLTSQTVDAWRDGLCSPGGKRIGQVKRIFPLALLEDHLPQDATSRRLFAKICKEEGLLTDEKIRPLGMIDIGTVEALVEAPKPPSLLTLVAKHAGSPQRSRPLREFIAKQGHPVEPDADMTDQAFRKLTRGVRKTLGI